MSTDPILARLEEWVESSRKEQGLEKTVHDVKALRAIVALLNEEKPE